MPRRVAMYFSWDRAAEVSAPLELLDNRFPALFEVRRLFWPHYESLADPIRHDQGIDGFLANIFLENFSRFRQLTQAWTGTAVEVMQRRSSAGETLLDSKWLAQVDTLIIISFDGPRSGQSATVADIMALQSFLDDPGHTVFVCPHHDIGSDDSASGEDLLARQTLEFNHHGDRAIPGQQRFGGFARSLMKGLGLPIANRFGLRPARQADGSPQPVAVVADRQQLFAGVTSLNLHPHLPHLERLDASQQRLEVLVRQRVDPTAPSHPAFSGDRTQFDAVLQAAPGVVAGTLIVADATLWSSAASTESLERFWRNVVLAPAAG